MQYNKIFRIIQNIDWISQYSDIFLNFEFYEKRKVFEIPDRVSTNKKIFAAIVNKKIYERIRKHESCLVLC